MRKLSLGISSFPPTDGRPFEGQALGPMQQCECPVGEPLLQDYLKTLSPAAKEVPLTRLKEISGNVCAQIRIEMCAFREEIK